MPEITTSAPEQPSGMTIPQLINISSILIAKKMMAEDWDAVEKLTISQQNLCKSAATLTLVDTITSKINNFGGDITDAIVKNIFRNMKTFNAD
jgi:hypothetical protein